MSILQKIALHCPANLWRSAISRHGRILTNGVLNYSQEVAKKTTEQAAPIKFSTSEAHVNYKAARNFYGDDRNLPDSHNYVIAGTGILGFYYLIFLRDDIDADGGTALIKPVHETVPQYAIPLLQSAIAENKRLGYNTKKLESKLAEYMENPEKHGGEGHKLIEN